MSRSRTAPVEFREGVNAWASPGALAPIAAVCPGICRSEDYLSQAQAPLLKLAPQIKYPRAFFCCDCYLELIAGALFFIRDLRYKSFQMRIGFAHIFQIVDLRFCHDGPMIIDAFKAIKRRRLYSLPAIPRPPDGSRAPYTSLRAFPGHPSASIFRFRISSMSNTCSAVGVFRRAYQSVDY